jgi:hypothetical protein
MRRIAASVTSCPAILARRRGRDHPHVPRGLPASHQPAFSRRADPVTARCRHDRRHRLGHRLRGTAAAGGRAAASAASARRHRRGAGVRPPARRAAGLRPAPRPVAGDGAAVARAPRPAADGASPAAARSSMIRRTRRCPPRCSHGGRRVLSVASWNEPLSSGGSPPPASCACDRSRSTGRRDVVGELEHGFVLRRAVGLESTSTMSIAPGGA